MKELRIRIAQHIANGRKAKDLSQAELAALCNLSITTIKRMEGTDQWPGLRQYITVCQVLGIGLMSYP